MTQSTLDFHDSSAENGQVTFVFFTTWVDIQLRKYSFETYHFFDDIFLWI